MTRPRWLSWLLVLLLFPLAASAAPRRVLVFRLTGEVPGDTGGGLGRMTDVIARAAGLLGATISQSKVSLADASALAGCSTEDAVCLTAVAGALGVDDVVLGKVEPQPDGGAKISLTLFLQGTVSEKTVHLPPGSVDAMLEELGREAPRVFLGPGQQPIKPDPPPVPEKQPEPVVVAPPPAPRDEGGFRAGRVKAWTWVIVGAGVAATGTGVAFQILARGKQGEVDDAPTNTAADFDRLAELEDQGERYNRFGNYLLIGGGALVVGGVVLVVVQGLSGSSEQPRAQVSPVLLGRGGGVTVSIPLP